MNQPVTRRFILGGLGALAAAGAAQANAPSSSLYPQLRPAGVRSRSAADASGVIARAGLSGDVVCSVGDLNSGLRLEGVRADAGLPPASVAKALTALYALDTLGAEHRFRTRLMATGTLRNGVLDGDLILVGGGDPTLDTDHLGTMAANLKEAGLRELRGSFKVYDGALPYVRTIDPLQPPHVGYSPAVAGIALNFNRVHFEWKRAGQGYSVTMDARSARYRPDVAMATMRVEPRSVPVYTYEDRGGADRWTVAHGALGNGGARWLPVRRPAEYAGEVFATLARAQGIVLPKADIIRRLPQGAETLVQHNSAALSVILRDMLKYSTNVTAEMVGLSASVARGAAPASLAASGAAMSAWASSAYGMGRTAMVDHSGLGDASRMAPDDLVGALIKVHRRGVLRPLMKPFAMRDRDGRVNKNHPIKVDAKTGTLNFVSGLGGFMTAPNGTNLAFAIFTADMSRRSRIAPTNRERPEGARGWNRQSRKLQQQLIERWGALYGS